MKKRIFSIILAFVCCAVMSACEKSSSDKTWEEKIGNKSVQDGLCSLEMPDVASVKIKSFEIVTDESEACVAFTMQFTNLSDTSACFNDIGSRNGILQFYQDGVKLEPRYTSKTQNISHKIEKNNSIDVVKAYALKNTTSDIIVKFEDMSSCISIKNCTN